MRIEKITILKFIDHWIGGPICILLVLFYRLTHPFYKTQLHIPAWELPPRNVLIMKFFGIGSITLASSIVISIREKYPDTKIYFITFKENREILQILSLADKVMIIDPRNPLLLAQSIVQSLFFCWKERIEVVFDIEFYSKFSTIMTFLSGARWRVGFYLGRFWRTSLINVPIYFNSNRHLIEIYAMFTKTLLIDNSDLKTRSIVTTQEDRADLSVLLKDHHIADLKSSIAFNIHASDLAFCRRWPLKHFASLAEMFLDENKGMNIVLTGTRSETGYSREFLGLLATPYRQRVIDLTGELSLRQFLTFLSQLPLLVTNDTGPFHLAKAVGARTISLWGPSSINLYGPYGKEKETHSVIRKDYFCSPCMQLYRTEAGYFCHGKAPCMEDIRPEEVMELVRKRSG